MAFNARLAKVAACCHNTCHRWVTVMHNDSANKVCCAKQIHQLGLNRPGASLRL